MRTDEAPAAEATDARGRRLRTGVLVAVAALAYAVASLVVVTLPASDEVVALATAGGLTPAEAAAVPTSSPADFQANVLDVTPALRDAAGWRLARLQFVRGEGRIIAWFTTAPRGFERDVERLLGPQADRVVVREGAAMPDDVALLYGALTLQNVDAVTGATEPLPRLTVGPALVHDQAPEGDDT